MGTLSLTTSERSSVISRLRMDNETTILAQTEHGEESLGLPQFENRLLEGVNIARDIIRWLGSRKKRDITIDVFRRWGLISCDCKEVGDNQQYEIKRIAYSSGRVDGWLANTYYGSDRYRGGTKTFWPIDFHTLQCEPIELPGLPTSPVTSDGEDQPICSKVMQRDYVGPGFFELVFDKCQRDMFLDRVDAMCTKEPDKFFRITRPGCRGNSTTSEQHRIQERLVFCHANNGECIRASLANAMSLFAGNDEAISMLNKGPISGTCLAHVGSWLEGVMRVYTLKTPNVPSNLEATEWLMQQPDGIFLVRLRGVDNVNEDVDHVITVSPRERIVLDPAEHCALRLDTGVWDACVGDGFTMIGIQELKQLVRQPTGKRSSKRKPHKMSAAKRRQVRVKRRTEGMTKQKKPKHRRSVLKKIIVSDDEKNS